MGNARPPGALWPLSGGCIQVNRPWRSVMGRKWEAMPALQGAEPEPGQKIPLKATDFRPFAPLCRGKSGRKGL
jgi:hypothetical protein